MENKLYIILFFSLAWRPIVQPVPKQWSQNLQNSWDSWILQILLNSWISQNLPNLRKNTKLMEKFELMEKGSCPWPTPIYKLRMASMVWNIYNGHLGLAAWLCSLQALVHLLISQTQQTGKCPHFHSKNW